MHIVHLLVCYLNECCSFLHECDYDPKTRTSWEVTPFRPVKSYRRFETVLHASQSSSPFWAHITWRRITPRSSQTSVYASRQGVNSQSTWIFINPLNTELNPTCHMLALLGARHIFHVSGLRVNTTIDIFKCHEEVLTAEIL